MRRSLPRSDSAATLEVLEDRSGGAATLDALDALSEAASLDGDDALFDGLDDIVDVRRPRPNARSRGATRRLRRFRISVNCLDNRTRGSPRRASLSVELPSRSTLI